MTKEIIISLVYIFAWGLIGFFFARRTFPETMWYVLSIATSIMLGILIFLMIGFSLAAKAP